MSAPLRFAALAAVAVALAACSSAKPKFQEDQLLSNGPNQFSRSFAYGSADACEASRRALLSQGYMTTMTHNDTVDANKNFQPTVDQHIVVEVHVVCTAGDATNSSMVYVNAIQNGYALKKSDTSASVGLSILGSVSLPIRSNSDEMVKISSETIQSGSFYTRFFELVGRYLSTVARSEPVPGAGAIKVVPLPPPVAPITPVAAAVAEPPAPTVGSAAPAVAAAAAATGAAALHGTPAPVVVTTQPASGAAATMLVPPAMMPQPAAAASAAAPASAPAAASASVSTNTQSAAAAQTVASAPVAGSSATANAGHPGTGGASAAPAASSPANATAP
ncbi:DUF2242 domain-containing protein [Paraburkholderia acidisoli]|uniref:DUF2242 domain-containing protein n=1 Tax=Paraburkholderia acidisoli TaxID=2571748 RepID=UPI001E3DD8D1|nr:DUF2242 domain-containing protein [Paraburkholderia acidisoli]